YSPGSIQKAIDDGLRVVMVPEPIRNRLSGQQDTQGRPLIDLGGFLAAWNESFEFKWVESDQLTVSESEVWAIVGPLLALVLPGSERIKAVLLSESMRINPLTHAEAEGLWDARERRIVIKRTCLDTKVHLAATLLHEVGHVVSEAGDISSAFE